MNNQGFNIIDTIKSFFSRGLRTHKIYLNKNNKYEGAVVKLSKKLTIYEYLQDKKILEEEISRFISTMSQKCKFFSIERFKKILIKYLLK